MCTVLLPPGVNPVAVNIYYQPCLIVGAEVTEFLIGITTVVSWRKVCLHDHARGCTSHCTATLHELLRGASKEIMSL